MASSLRINIRYRSLGCTFTPDGDTAIEVFKVLPGPSEHVIGTNKWIQHGNLKPVARDWNIVWSADVWMSRADGQSIVGDAFRSHARLARGTVRSRVRQSCIRGVFWTSQADRHLWRRAYQTAQRWIACRRCPWAQVARARHRRPFGCCNGSGNQRYFDQTRILLYGANLRRYWEQWYMVRFSSLIINNAKLPKINTISIGYTQDLFIIYI